MNIYKPKEVPRPKPVVWGEKFYEVPAGRHMWYDGQIRWGMQHALKMDSTQILEITKTLEASRLAPLRGAEATLQYPYAMPPVVYTTGCMSDAWECENRLLKVFAFDAYEALAAHFGASPWQGWFIAPFFPEGDATQQSFQLGVFVDEQFIHEVVE